MKKLVKETCAKLLGLQFSRVDSTMVIPKPKAGPAKFRCQGIEWNESLVDEIMEGPLVVYADEYNQFRSTPTDNPDHFYSNNPFFGFVDAAVCYALIRNGEPATVVEIGSGHSSRVIRAALDQNGSGRLVSIDPNPRASVADVSDEHLPMVVQKMQSEWFEELSDDSILFIDSSHQAGTGSDVNFLFLEVLPALQPGVLIHIHDIYLPDDYPIHWNIDRKFNYSEQYLLQALLTFSSGFRVVWPGRWVLQNKRTELSALMRPGEKLERHCSFWMQRI
jgi:hypothetical protein